MSLGGVTRTYIVAVLATPLLVASSMAHADPADASGGGDHHAHDHRAPDTVRHDYSRFSDGPRRVPTSRGPTAERARQLGLGTREAASRVLRGPVPDEWRRAADWRRTNVDRLLWPVDEGRYARGYGYVRVTRPDLLHKGVDIAAPSGAVVRAVADGIVAYSDNGLRGYGNCVIILHPNGWVSLYAHNSRTTVQPGWRVRRGERIALVGSTGISHGPHVHFELRDGGPAIDPLALFDGGPAYVQRVAQRAAAAGRVPLPREPSAEDRQVPAPLPPWQDDAPAARTPVASTAAGSAADEEGSGDEDDVSSDLDGLALGSRALLRRLTRAAPSEAMTQAAGGRLFRSVLWPMRGGRAEPRRGALRGLNDVAAPVRATADGLVVYSASAGRRGHTLVVLHRTGWVSVYRGVDEVHVEPGQRIQRGEWIGEAARFELELRVDGRRTDPLSLMVHVPE
jgi:murein DD-endopeptidase MepM/ murein hydrolase activator NlpD